MHKVESTHGGLFQGGRSKAEVDALVQAALLADDTAVRACLDQYTGLPA